MWMLGDSSRVDIGGGLRFLRSGRPEVTIRWCRRHHLIALSDHPDTGIDMGALMPEELNPTLVSSSFSGDPDWGGTYKIVATHASHATHDETWLIQRWARWAQFVALTGCLHASVYIKVNNATSINAAIISSSFHWQESMGRWWIWVPLHDDSTVSITSGLSAVSQIGSLIYNDKLLSIRNLYMSLNHFCPIFKGNTKAL